MAGARGAGRGAGACARRLPGASLTPRRRGRLDRRPPPHLLICMRRCHWPRRGTPPSPLAGGKPGRPPRGRRSAQGRPPGGPGQVEGAPARCVPGRAGSQGAGGSRRTASSRLRGLPGQTDILGGLIPGGIITLRLLFYERNLQLPSFRSRRGREVEGRARVRVRLVRRWPPAQTQESQYITF